MEINQMQTKYVLGFRKVYTVKRYSVSMLHFYQASQVYFADNK